MPTKDLQPLAGPIQTGQPTLTPLTPLVGPTVKSELLIMEYVDTEGPAYQILAYGAPYPDATKYPGYQLTLQRPVDHKIIQRFWTANRVSQELYDFALKYVDESAAHRIYVRTSVVALSEYAELSDGSADPVDPEAFLVHQEMKGWGEEVPPEIANLYRQIIRVYKVLPGVVLKNYRVDPQAQGATTLTSSQLIRNASGDPGTLSGAFGTLSAERKTDQVGESREIITSLPNPGGGIVFPVLTEKKWDEFAQAILTITKQVVPQGSVTPGNSNGILTEVQPIDKYHDLKVTSQFGTGSPAPLPPEQIIPMSVEIATPEWFTAGPTQVTATGGYVVDVGMSYSTESTHGKFAGTLTKTFFNSIPTAPSGTYLNFQPVSVRVATAYGVSGDADYAKINYYEEPNHIPAAPSGPYILDSQCQQHGPVWVRETITIML